MNMNARLEPEWISPVSPYPSNLDAVGVNDFLFTSTIDASKRPSRCYSISRREDGSKQNFSGFVNLRSEL